MLCTAEKVRTNAWKVLLGIFTHGRNSDGQQARTCIHWLCADTRCSLENLPGAIDDRDGWWETAVQTTRRDQDVSIITFIIILFLASFSLWSVSDTQSHQVSRTLLSNLADLNNAVVWIVLIRTPISNCSNPFSNSLGTAHSTSLGMTVTCIFDNFVLVLWWSVCQSPLISVSRPPQGILISWLFTFQNRKIYK